MKGKLVIHIGPPKTASTSLQTFLQKLETENFVYGGIIQPRKNDINSISKRLYTLCKASNGLENKKEIETLQEDISQILSQTKYLFLSEERLVLVSTGRSYLTKLKALYEIVKEFEPRIIFCVRNPLQALPSYYQEIYHTLPNELSNSFDLFQKSQFAICYQYKNLIENLNEIGFKDLFWFYFNELSGNKYFLNDILGYDEKSLKEIKVELHQINVSKVSGNKRMLKRKSRIESSFRSLFLKLPETIRGFGIGGKVITFIGLFFKRKVVLKVNEKILKKYENDLTYLKSAK
jgi:hypothetical protein